jgi:hypothetical protein
MTIYNKLKWILGIVLVFVLIVTTNLIDRNTFLQVNDSVVSIYEDRLLAKVLIYDIAQSVHEKELALAAADTAFWRTRNVAVNTSILQDLASFEQTKLTYKENRVFDNLKQSLQRLTNAETAFLHARFADKSELSRGLAGIRGLLDELSVIQVDEGSRQMAISQRALETAELFTQIEIYLLIVLAIVIQIMIIYQPRKRA